MTSAADVPVPVVGAGATDGGVKRSGGPLTDPGARTRSFGGGSVLGYLGDGARQVAAAPQGART